MLEDIMKMELDKFEEDRSRLSEDAIKVNNALSEVIKKIEKTDASLGHELDKITGLLITAYGDMYFELGFKKGITLSNEIREVSQNGMC